MRIFKDELSVGPTMRSVHLKKKTISKNAEHWQEKNVLWPKKRAPFSLFESRKRRKADKTGNDLGKTWSARLANVSIMFQTLKKGGHFFGF